MEYREANRNDIEVFVENGVEKILLDYTDMGLPLYKKYLTENG